MLQFINHGDDARQNGATHPKMTVFDLLAVKQPRGSSPLHDDLDFSTRRAIIRADINAGNGAKEAMSDQSALDFVPDLAQSGVEFLSQLLVVHFALRPQR
jgi:hypothetical protein